MRNICFLFFAVLIGTSCFGQKSEIVYLNPKDSNANYYIIVNPTKIPLTGFMFLIPGMFQKPQDVLVQTDLPKIAARNGILTIIPVFKTGISSLGIDTATQASFLELLSHIRNKHHITSHRFFVGGFSIGGTCAIKYAELALSNDYPFKPTAVFAIDSPLDFERAYNTSTRELKLAGIDKELLAETIYMLKRFDKEFGGAPANFLPRYHSSSPYSYSDTSQQAIKPLIHLPIRLYTEPDIQWWLKEGVDYYGMNAFDFAAITNDLHKMGSKKITLITTTDKGYRKPDNKKHPHSWSIVKADELVQWLLVQK